MAAKHDCFVSAPVDMKDIEDVPGIDEVIGCRLRKKVSQRARTHTHTHTHIHTHIHTPSQYTLHIVLRVIFLRCGFEAWKVGQWIDGYTDDTLLLHL